MWGLLLSLPLSLLLSLLLLLLLSSLSLSSMLRLSLHNLHIPRPQHLLLSPRQRPKLLARHAERREEVVDVDLGLALALAGVLWLALGLAWILTLAWVGSGMSTVSVQMRWMART